jgi:hypothetical protein
VVRTSLASEGREIGKQAAIERRKIENGDRVRQEPGNLGGFKRARNASQNRAAVNAKVDVGPLFSWVEASPDFLADLDRDSQFLLNLSSEGTFLSLPGFDLASGKLPESPEVWCVLASSSEQYSSVILKQTRNDQERGGGHRRGSSRLNRGWSSRVLDPDVAHRRS